MPVPLIAGAALAGLLGAPHCVAMCGAFSTLCARRASGALGWNAGRIATYALLGATFGSLGGRIPGPRWLPVALSTGMLLWFSLGLAGVRIKGVGAPPALTAVASRFAPRNGVMWRLLFGISTGLLPCGMVYAALGLAAAAGGALDGAAVMVAFGVATLPALVFFAAAVRRFADDSIWRRRVLGFLVLATGIWSISARRAQPIGRASNEHARHPHLHQQSP